MPRVTRLLVTGLLVAATAQAQDEGLLKGVTVRFHGGLDHLAGLDGLNDQIHGMNAYFGENGTWVEDAQGQVQENGWAPYLKIRDLGNRPDMGLTVERNMLTGERSRMVAGIEYTSGAASTSNLFEFTPGSGFHASVFAKEALEVKNIMATCRFSLKDANLPLHAHAGFGLGQGQITATGVYFQQQTIGFETDPMFGELAPMHLVQADYDGKSLTGRLFIGSEVELGPISFLVDLGYNYMDFGKLTGATTETFRDKFGVMQAMAVTNVPTTRYEFAPLISASLQRTVINAFRVANGLPEDTSPVDLADPNLQWGAPKAIEYDLSGGYARFSVGYRF